jgi:hypothetical protein
MDGLGHAIWAARSERKFRPIKPVDNNEGALKDRKIQELQAQNRRLVEQLKAAEIELFTFRQWDESRIAFLPIKEIASIVCRYFRISGVDLISQSRQGSVILPRHIAFYLCRVHTMKSYPEIGRWMGKRDHTSILHGSRKIDGLRRTDPEISNHIIELDRLIAARLREMQETTKIVSLPVPTGAPAVTPLAAGAPPLK